MTSTPCGTHGWWRRAAALLLGLALLSTGARAQLPGLEPGGDEAAEEQAVEAPEPVSAARSSPRATMMSFLDAMNDVAKGLEHRIDEAVACLDLSELSPLIRRDRGIEAAIQLKEAIDRLEYVHRSQVPARQEGEPWTFVSRREGRVAIARTGDGEWLFTTDTVASVAVLYDSVKDLSRLSGKPIDITRFVASRRLRSKVPEALQDKAFLLEHWQWLALALLAFLGVLADKLSVLLSGFVARLSFGGDELSDEERQDLKRNLRPIGLVVMGLVWQWGLPWLDLPHQAHVYLIVATEFVVALASIWGAYRLVNVLGEWLTHWAAHTESTLDDLLVPLVVKSLKVFITALVVVLLADRLAIEIAPLLTGLGLGGLAFALAAKDMVGNLFGSVMVIFDRTFQVGDWVVIDDIEGTVEQVGFRSTRIRTFYNSLITLPNSNLVTSSVDNYGRRRYRRWKTTLSLTYGTPPGRIEAFCEGVRELVRRHPYTRKDYYQVYLNSFGPASLDVLVYIFFSTPDWSTELRERHRLMLDVIRLAQRLGVDFAFPTQTLHLVQDDGTPPEPGDESYMTQREVSQASLRGRKEARDILEAFGIDEGTKPPPVRFDVAPEVNRGDSADG